MHIDHMECPQPGLIPQTRGRLQHRWFVGASLYVDGATGFKLTQLQTSLDAHETLAAKKSIERRCKAMGVTIKNYHSDNGRFAEKTFLTDVASSQQNITHCGVGAHHQNSIAELGIKHTTQRARTMLAQARLMWPEAISTCLWPYAWIAAIESENDMVDEYGRSKRQRFAGNPDYTHDLTDSHVWGCPVYVLSAPLQGDIKTPRWDMRSRVGVYLGPSPNHATSVPLVLNLATGHVSPQFHVIFDDNFSTLTDLRQPGQPINPETWKELAEHAHSYCDPDIDYDIRDLWFTESPAESDDQPSNSNDASAATDNSSSLDDSTGNFSTKADDIDINVLDTKDEAGPFTSDTDGTPKRSNITQPPRHRYNLRRHNNNRLLHFFTFAFATVSTIFLSGRHFLQQSATHLATMQQQQFLLSMLPDGTFNHDYHPLFNFVASHADKYTMNLHEALKQPDCEAFVQAMSKEWADPPREDIGRYIYAPVSQFTSCKTTSFRPSGA